MGKEKKMTFSFYVSVNGSPPEDTSKMSEEKRKETFDILGRQYIKNGLRGEVVTA